MRVPCVRVPVEEGEAIRTLLADAGLLDGDREISVEDDDIYIPVVDADAVPAEYEVVEREAAERTGQVTPDEILGYEPSYERLGDIAIVDVDDPGEARRVAEAILESDFPCRTVVNRASKVKGEYRVRDWEVLAGDDPEDGPEGGGTPSRPRTETVHREYGHEFLLDIAEVYFSPRLATERHRVVEQVEVGEHAFDMFAGVGPFAVPMAARGAEVVACDVNPRAVEYLRENARRNGVSENLTAIEGDVREVAADYGNWADRVVANLPHSATEFLDTAVALAGEECVLHLYDIQHEDDPFGPGERAVRAAAGGEYEVTVETRREVRSYAPHEVNVCLDVRLSRV
ncbi:class I SAM-dependent methyltransferase [Halorarum salinum]|uniref:Class I SAM-dependent methyltransferase family protein n=1 Tax=Halorarum salinum TaxID=2743089 RepID=A0A7D5Q814_9EURY|nr:class I SAM-dependent methyltransferase family protein [Halobaculum salinum]QLG60496.1 class I SAM-dependent methyltransferase family protein [Halobaculum salinum]